MSDGVAALVDGERPAALSDGEHVVPSLQVAMLGRGSTKAGSEVVKDLVLSHLTKMYGQNVDPVKMQSKAMKD